MKYIINNENNGISIKEFLRKNSVSSNLLKRLKKISNGILVNGMHQNVIYLLKENDVLEINVDDSDVDSNEYLTPTDIHIDIIYEDENITVINKPSNMPTHESLNNRGNTLANALKFKYQNKPYVFRATNRLDKDTSGVVVTANNKYYASLLSKKMQNGEMSKEYIAVVGGKMTGKGVINAPIDRVGESIIKRTVTERGETAITEYEVIESRDEASLVKLRPITGRTHQLRVHMAHLGHPISGDELYGGDLTSIKRQALHCLKMQINEIGSFYAPIPTDMVELINKYFKNIKIKEL